MKTLAAHLLVLAGLGLVVLANPVKRATNNKCATECSGTSSKFRYEVGKSYNYQYETEAKVKLAGITQNEAAVRLEANVQISVLEPCEYSLKLSQIKITGPTAADLGSDWTQELPKHVTRFSFDDGEVGEICPKDEEPTWALNIKRAVLSAFQNAQAGRSDTVETYEEDVSGRCPTKFEYKQATADETRIVKTKDLVSCFNRYGNHTAIRLIPYEVRSGIQGTPFIDSKQKCTQIIRRGILNEAICEEKHVIKRSNNEDKGGMIATAMQKLHFQNENGNIARGDVGHAEKLYFDHKEHEHLESKQGLGDARQNLKDLCKTSKDEVRPETPSLFNELVYNLRKLSLPDLKTLYQESQSSAECEFGKQSLLNALPMCGDTACVSLLADILKNNIDKLTGIQRKVYFTSFALVPHASKEMIVAVTPLVGSIPKEGLLGVSTLVHTYCRDNPSCGDHPEVKAILQKFTETLGAKCTAANDEARDTIVYTLKALGNIGHSTESVEKRVNCLKEKTNAIDIRLAAVQSLRRVPCEARVAPLKERFADGEENIEVRLTSFLTFMECATPEIVDSVKEILEKEQIHQVGSFVKTYFEQIRTSTDPSKHAIQSLLSSQYISKRFNSDPRKYSRFYETSKFSSRWNFGGHADSAMIFTNDGYMPRQGFLNLTMDYFGSEINLLEIGGRAEGLEKLADDLFGPNGYFTNPTGFYFKQEKKPHKNPRVVELQNKFGKDIKKNQNLDLSYYIRIFGDEIAYNHMRDINLMDKYTKTMQTVMSSLKSSQQANVKLARANQLMNHYLALPTASGLPLHLAVNSTIALNIEFEGKIDLSKLMKEKNADLRASLKPSAAIERAFIFAIHAGHSKFGIRIQERTHSSTAANIVMELRNGEAFKSSLELPKQKNEILQYDFKLFTIKNNVPTEEPGITKNRVSGEICTPDRLNKWIGFKICHEAAFANATGVPDAPYFPLTGPVRYAATLEKTDPQLKTYEFSAAWKNTATSRTAKLSFNTPGSSVDREIAIDYDYQRGKSLNLKFRSPLKKLDAAGTLETTGQTQKGQIKIKVDDAREYTLIGTQETQATQTGRRKTYNGEIARPGQQPVKISATEVLDLPQSGLFKRTFDLKADNLYETPVELHSAVERTGQRQGKVDWNLKSPNFIGKIMGKVTQDGDIRNAFMFRDDTVKSEFDWNFEIQQPKSSNPEPHKFDLKYNLDYTRRGGVLKLEETIKTKCNQNPTTNLDYKMIIDKSPEKADVKFQAVDGKGRDIIFDLSSKREQADNRHSGTANLKSTKWHLDHKADFQYQNNLPRQFAATVKMDTPDTKNIQAEAKYTQNPSQGTEGEAKLTYPGRDVRIYKKMQSVGGDKYKSNVILQWQKDQKVQMDSDITYNPRANDYELKTVATGTDGQPWTFNKKVKIGDDMSVKSVATLQKGSQTVYDWKLDLTKDGPKKQKLQAQFRSDYGNNKVDMATDGYVEDTGAGRKVVFTSKKDQKDFMKGELVIPKTYSMQDPNKHVKVDLSWDRSAVLFDYACSRPAKDQIQIDSTLKLDVPQYGSPINRKLNLKIAGTDSKTVNVAWFKDNTQVLEGTVTRIMKQSAGKEGSVEAKLKTMEPWTKRDITGLVTYKFDGNSYGASLKTDNAIDNRHLVLRADLVKEGENKRRLETENLFNGRGLKTKHTYERVEADSLRKLSGELEYFDGQSAQPQKTVHQWSVKTSPGFTVTSKLQTPMAQLKDFDGTVDLLKQGKQHKHNIDLKWNQNQNLKIQVKGDVSADNSNVDGSLQSTLEGLKSGQFTWKSDFRTGRDFEARLDWNDVNKLRSYHKRTSQPTGDEKWSTGIEATIPNTANYKASANVDWNANTGKYKAATESQYNGGGAYKVQADFDTRSKEGTVEVNTPTDQLKSAKAQVNKIGENEYELKVVQNAQSMADVKATLKLDQDKQKIAIEVKNIKKPFKTQFEHEWTAKHFLFGGEVNFDLQDPKKAYGIKISSDRPNENTCDTQAWLTYPSRQLRIRRQVNNQLPNKLDWTLEIQSNPDKPGTKLQLNLDKPSENQFKGGFHVTKDQHPGFHVEGTMQRTGTCRAFIREECRINGDVQIRYSNEPNKHITHKFKLNREIVEQRPKYSYEVQSTHPATNIQLKHHGTLLAANCLTRSTDCKRIFEFGIEALDKQKQVQAYKFKFETDSQRNALAEMTHPSGKWTEVFQCDGDQMKVVVKRDDKAVYEVVAGYDRPDKEARIEIKDAATNEVIIHAGAKKPSPDSFELQLWHSQNKSKVEDISVITTLREDSRVRSRLFVRPGFKDDYGNYLKTRWERVKENVRGKEYEDSAFGQLQQARQALRADVMASTKPMVDEWQQQSDAIGRELGVNFSGVRDLIMNFVNALRDYRRMIRDNLSELMARLTSSAPSQTLKKLSDDVQRYIPEAIEKIRKMIDGISASTKQLYDSASGTMANWRRTRDDVYKNLRIDDLKTYLKNTYEELRQQPLIRKLIEFFTSLGGYAPDMSWERMKETASNLNQRATQAATETRQQVENQAAAWRDDLLRNEDTKVIAKFVQEAYNRIVWHFSRMGPGDKMRGFYDWITQEYKDMTTGGPAKQFLPSTKDSQPEKGIYVIEGTIPGQFRSIDEIANKFQVDRLKQMKNAITDRFSGVARDADYAVRDVLLNVQPSSVGSTLRSPLSSTAVLAGDQHFITFDDEEYDFAGECDYLLARDFENGEFTIFGSFERRGNSVARKSVTVEYQEHKVEISYDNKVKIDDKESELPWHSMNDETNDVILKVYRREHSVVVRAIDGLTVECDGHYHVCRITVPKRYHGKSGGLLGINDFEPYNEFTKPDHKRTANVAEFAREWSTNSGCRVTDNQANQEYVTSGPLYEECENLLNSSSSPLRPCFHRLPPLPYLSMCLTDAKQLSARSGDIATQKQGLCNSAAAYIEACEEQRVALDLPSHCIKCEVGGKKLNQDETTRIEGAEVLTQADVIFIVEQRKCMAWTKAQLPQIAQKVEAGLKQQRFDTRFGLVGFNGEGVYYGPHFQTGQGSLSLTLDALRAAAGQLTYSERERRMFNDPLLAVKFAADHFPFRAGTRKLLVLFSCEECMGTAVDYFELQSELLQMSVSLQLVTASKIELGSPAPGAPTIIAVDASTMYAADMSEKPDLRSQLVEPHDSCTVLTQETNGTVLSYSEQNLPAITQLLTQKLTKSVIPAGQVRCQICECQEHEHAPRTVCFPCEIPRPASLTRDSTGFFNNPFVRLQKWQKKAQDTLNRVTPGRF